MTNFAQDLLLAQHALSALFSVTNKLQMRGDKYLVDISIRQMLAIPPIIHAPDGNATINHIARELGTTKQSAKQIVDAMEKKGYVSVDPSELDKRAVNVKITPLGERAFKVCSERMDMFLADIFHSFSTEDMEALWTLLKRLYSFDGADTSGFDIGMNQHNGDAETVLRHHQDYLKRPAMNVKQGLTKIVSK